MWRYKLREMQAVRKIFVKASLGALNVERSDREKTATARQVLRRLEYVYSAKEKHVLVLAGYCYSWQSTGVE
jgi:hypothetical protein